MKKTIVWGHPKTNNSHDVNITSIHVDNLNDIVCVLREIGSDVKNIRLTMEEAQDIGLINLDMLEDYV